MHGAERVHSERPGGGGRLPLHAVLVVQEFGVEVGRTPKEREFRPWGLFRGIVGFCTAQYGTVCSGHPSNMLYLKGRSSHRAHGVQGVECSNHSVPTIYS